MRTLPDRLYPYMAQTGSSGVSSFSYKGTNPIISALPSPKLTYLPMAPFPNTITLGVEGGGGLAFNILISGENTIHFIAPSLLVIPSPGKFVRMPTDILPVMSGVRSQILCFNIQECEEQVASGPSCEKLQG